MKVESRDGKKMGIPSGGSLFGVARLAAFGSTLVYFGYHASNKGLQGHGSQIKW